MGGEKHEHGIPISTTFSALVVESYGVATDPAVDYMGAAERFTATPVGDFIATNNPSTGCHFGCQSAGDAGL